MHAVTVTLLFTGAGVAEAPAGCLSPPDEGYALGDREAGMEDEPPSGEPGHRRFMLIILGPWVEEPETWDESPWGGSGTAMRRGRGYYEGMTQTRNCSTPAACSGGSSLVPESGRALGTPLSPRRDRSRGSADHEDDRAALGQVRLPGPHGE